MDVTGEEIHQLLNELDTNHNGQVEVEEYLQVRSTSYTLLLFFLVFVLSVFFECFLLLYVFVWFSMLLLFNVKCDF